VVYPVSRSKGGPNVLAGFIDAPVRGPPTRMSNKTTTPIAIPANPGGALLSTASPKMVNTSRKVSIASTRTPVPKPTFVPKKSICTIFSWAQVLDFLWVSFSLYWT
jgi:hypothetical protein